MSIDWDDYSGRNDPAQKMRIYRLCPGETEPELVATCADDAAVGVAICTLAREGEFDVENGDCSIGLLDTMGEVGRRWLIKPWLASPKNCSDAGRVLNRRRRQLAESP
jgi:hypothetical protein